MSLAKDFAMELRSAWHQKAANTPFLEVPLFRALMDSFLSLSKRFKIEEFHGTKYQVGFAGKGSWGRPLARCELSDLLIVPYRTQPGFHARMTFLKAKRSTGLHDMCRAYPQLINSTSFKANLEQWDLLSRRPKIIGIYSFDPPVGLLRDAILPSVGSFGVFHRRNNHIDFFYMVADALAPIGSPTRKHAKVVTTGADFEHMINGFPEQRMACCIAIFGETLFECKIGTPISFDSVISESDRNYRNTTRKWLGTILGQHVSASDAESPITNNLIRSFEIDIGEVAENQYLPNVIVINTDESA